MRLHRPAAQYKLTDEYIVLKFYLHFVTNLVTVRVFSLKEEMKSQANKKKTFFFKACSNFLHLL